MNIFIFFLELLKLKINETFNYNPNKKKAKMFKNLIIAEETWLMAVFSSLSYVNERTYHG